MFGGYGGRFLAQGIYFLLLARTLGASGLGTFAGVLAFVAILSPFSGWGSGEILVMRVSRKHSLLPRMWGAALLRTGVTALLLTVFSVVVGAAIFDESYVALILYVGLAEFFFNRTATIAGQVFQAVERLRMTAIIYVVRGCTRLGAIFLYRGFVGTSAATDWAKWYLAANLVAAIFGVVVVTYHYGKAEFFKEDVVSELREGLFFAVGLASRSVYTDADKTMLEQMTSSATAGLYAAAYRVVDVAFTPVRALLSAVYARFFQAGAESVTQTRRELRKVLTWSALYGVCVGVALYSLAPTLPVLLGRDFEGAVPVLQLLSVIPVVQAIHFSYGNGLTGMGFQGMRSVIQISVAIFNVIINFPLIMYYSWRGAVCATILSEVVLAISLYVAFRKICESKRNT